MVALTFGDARVTSVKIDQKALPGASADTAPGMTAAPRMSWTARFFDAMMRARMWQAEREIRLYSHLIPENERKVGVGATEKPSGGW